MSNVPNIPLGYIINNLFKGVIYKENDEKLWHAVLKYQHNVHDYVLVIELELIIDEAEGYAFLRQRDSVNNEDTDFVVPKLMSSRQLGFIMSVLCLLLRKCLIEQDASGTAERTIITHQQLITLCQVYLRDKNNEAKLIDQLEINIKKLIEYGLLRPLKHTPSVYEIRRIVKALINADWLASLNEKLQEYAKHAERTTEL